MKKTILLFLLVSGLFFISGCDSLFGPQIYFKNTSSTTSLSLVIYDSAGSVYSTIGTIAAGSETSAENISAGDYVVAADISGTRYILDSFSIEDGKDFVGTYSQRTLNSTVSYGCDISEQ